MDSIATHDPLCPGSCDGTAVVLTTSLAVPPFQYNWGSGWAVDDSINNGLCQGYQEIRFRDANGCTVSANILLTDPLPPTITPTATHIHCLENCTGSIDISIAPGSSPPYSILWLDDSSTTASRNGLCAGSYVVQVSDANGCTFFDTVEILENIDISIDISDIQNSCSYDCSGHATVSVSGGTMPYSYIWSSGETTPTAQQLCEGMAVVVAVDSVGCTVSDSIMIVSQQSFESLLVWADDSVIFAGKSTALHVSQIPHGIYWWSPSTMVDNPSSSDPIATLDEATVFVVTVTDSIGCTYSDSVSVNCINVNCGKPNIFIPNAFTPNGDGKNDRLCISGEWVDEFHISIFTRWGEKVYESDDMTECWDGRFRNDPCMPGVYVYHCRIKCADGQESQFKGDVTIIK